MIRFFLRFPSVAGLALALCASGPAYAQVYKWTDEKGEVHFSDSPYSMKDAKGQGTLIIPPKKARKEPEPEPEPAADEPAVQPAPEAAQDKPAEQPAPKKEEAAKISTPQPAPAEQVKMRKRVLKAKKLEKEKSASGQTTTPAESPATAP